MAEGLTLDDLLVIQLGLNAEIDNQQRVIDGMGIRVVLPTDEERKTYNLAQKRLAKAEAALDKVQAVIDARMSGDTASAPIVESTVTIRMGDNGKVQIDLEQRPHLYAQEALTIARLALDDVLAHLVNDKMGRAKWWVDWPNL